VKTILSVFLVLILPFANARVIDLPAKPTPAELKSAKAAFKKGDIVATELPNPARFASKFNFTLPSPASGHRPKPPCMMAARLTPSGQVDIFMGNNVGWRPAVTSECLASFEKWKAKESLLDGTPVLTGWTYIAAISPGPQYSDKGNQVELMGAVYRANSVDQRSDYYLVTLSATPTPTANFSTTLLDFGISATASGGGLYPIFEYAPADTNQTSLSVGADIPYAPEVVGAYSQSGLNPGAYFNGDGKSWGEWTYYQYVEQGDTAAAIIFKLPAGASHFTLSVEALANFQDGSTQDSELAQHLALLEPENPRQASLRRAVSTAYYALFHLLISEATLNWSRVELRSTLGRVFEHGNMKSASEAKRSEINLEFKKKPVSKPQSAISAHLRRVVDTFIQAQRKRNDADYDTSIDWTRTDVLAQIALFQPPSKAGAPFAKSQLHKLILYRY
jgi:hypothetical protein